MGYNNVTPNAEGSRAPLFGLCFTPVSGKTFTLADFKPVNGTMSSEDDAIQVLNPDKLSQNLELFAYYDEATARQAEKDDGESEGAYQEYVGWWDILHGDGIGDIPAGDYEISAGAGFMGAFDSGNEVKFTSAGEAPTVPTSITANPDGTRAPIFNNYLPRAITLKYFTPVDGMMSSEDDAIQVLNPNKLSQNLELFAYYDTSTARQAEKDDGESEGTYDEYIGWWDILHGDGIGDIPANDYEIPAGTGFMGAFDAGNEIDFQLPSSTATLD